MLKIEKVSDYLRVSGHSRASEWLYLPEQQPDGGFGIAGPDHIWTCNRSGTLRLLSVIDQSVHAEIDLGESLSRSLRLPSRDGRHLHLLQPIGESFKSQSRRLIVIDVPAGRIGAIHDGFPGYASEMTECADGRLMIDFIDKGSVVMLVNPLTGEKEVSVAASPRIVPERANIHFMSRSPDGRHWIKFDHARLARHLEPQTTIGRVFGRKGGEPRYGLSLQIWEAFPMRFVRQVTVAWLKVEDLPDETRLSARPVGLPDPDPVDPMVSRRAIWDAISSTLATADTGPLEDGPRREAYPAAFANDDKMWKRISENFIGLEKWARVVGWQPDGSAFWISTNHFLTCVGLDGTVSPRLLLARHGIKTAGVTHPLAGRFKSVEPLPDRKARVVYEDGTAIFDGRPHAEPYAILSIPADQDQWRPLDQTIPTAVQEAAAQRKVRVLERVRNKITIPVADWSEDGRIAAIEALAAEMTPEIYRMAVDSELLISFASTDRIVTEGDLFANLRSRSPATAQALKDLISRFVSVTPPHHFLFSVATEGIGLLAGAVRALGCMDRTALPLLKDYGRLVDEEHEYTFAGETVPAIAETHGWTEDVIDFVFWVIARNFYNAQMDVRGIWRQRGLRDALAVYDPDVAARRVLSAVDDLLPTASRPSLHGTPGIDSFAKAVADPADRWTEAFLQGLRRASPDATALMQGRR